MRLQIFAELLGTYLVDAFLHNCYLHITMKPSCLSAKPIRTLQLCIAGCLLSLVTLPASADSIEAGKTKAVSCVVCHGANGISQMPGAPNLAGQQAVYTMEQLKNFRSGKRSNEIMNVIAKPLSDSDINDLAVWFESIKSDSVAR